MIEIKRDKEEDEEILENIYLVQKKIIIVRDGIFITKETDRNTIKVSEEKRVDPPEIWIENPFLCGRPARRVN